MNRISTVPDKCIITVKIQRESLHKYLTPEKILLSQKYDTIKKFLKRFFCARFVKKSGISFEFEDLFVAYFPKFWQMDVSINPIKNWVKNNCQKNNTSAKSGLDGNTNWIPEELLTRDIKVIEKEIFDVFEETKNKAIGLFASILKGYFSIEIVEDDIAIALKEIEMASDYKCLNAIKSIRNLRDSIEQHFGEAKRWDDGFACGVTIFRDKGRRKSKQKMRNLYQKSAHTIRYEWIFRKNELPKDNIKQHSGKELQQLLTPFVDLVKSEFNFLSVNAEKVSTSKKIDKYAIAIWVWKKLSTVRIPKDKFVYVEKLIETGKIQYSLVGYPSLMEKIKAAGIVRPAIQSAGKQRHGLYALDIDKFLVENYDTE